jgi:hypothetical protein
MNPRASLVTATITLALIVPTAASAGSRTIPWDAPLSKQTITHRHVLKAGSAAIGLGAYNNWAGYVHGGASQKVAKAITAAAKTRTGNVCANAAQYRVVC